MFAPSVTSLSPRLGSTAGGLHVTIAGIGFTGATAVRFGAIAATFTVLSDNAIDAVSPAGSAGTVDVTVVNGATSATTAGDQFTYYALSASGSPVAGTEGLAITVPVASFTSGNPGAVAGDFTATINWGDGTTSAGTVSASSLGGFSVAGTHAYAEQGSYNLAVNISDAAGATASTSSTATVGDAVLSGTGRSVALIEGATFTGQVAGFTDANPNATVADFTATINWGDGTALSSGTIVANGLGGFTVSGSHVYSDEGSYSLSVGIVDDSGSGTAPTGTATVGDAALSVTGATIASTEGATFTGPVAGFRDANPNATAADFAATINWGDGTAPSNGTIAANALGGFTVSGSHAFAEEGTYSPSVGIVDDGGSHIAASGNASVGDAALSATGGTINPIEGATFTGPVASLSDANPSATASDFTAAINWGDGSAPSVGTIAANALGGFSVSGSHTYSEEGSFNLAVSIHDAGGAAAAAAATATVADAVLHGHGLNLGATRSTAFNRAVVTFTDDDPNGMVSDYTASVNWGDGTTSAAVVSAAAGGGFTATAQHAFREGRFSIVSTITDAGGASTSATSRIVVDLTPPVTTATVTGTLGTNGWWKSGSPTLLILTAVDNLSGVAATYFRLDGGPVTLYTGPMTLADGRHSIRFWSADGAGNVETVKTITVKVDHGLPAVTIRGVTDGARYMFGAVPTPTFTAGDPGSSIASSSSTLTPPATASGVGVYTFTATATDVAGNTTTVTVHYTVNYFFDFIAPLPPGPSIAAGRVLAVRIQLSDINGNPIATGVARLLVDGAPATPSGTFNTANLFRYQGGSQEYLYRLSTTGLAIGQHLLTVLLDDGTMREESFSLVAPAPFLLTVSPTSTLVGHTLTVSGTHYAPGSLVTIRFNGVVVGHVTATATGTFATSVTVPILAPLGTASVVASGVAIGGAMLLESRLIQLTG